MSRKTLSLLTLFSLGILLIGCNRGCTTSKTIASESTVVKTKGGNIEVVGRVIDYRHSRRVGRNVFNRSVSHSYGLSFDLKFGIFSQEEFYHEGVKNPDAVNLTKELKRIKVAISKDQNHIGLGVDGKVVDLIHLYKSNRIGTMDEKLVVDGTMDWANLDIESYPSPKSILTESLKNSCGELTYGKEALIEFCNSSKSSAKIHRILLDQWPNCNFAKNYLTKQKIQELSKSKKWRKSAIKRGNKALKNESNYGSNFKEVSDFILALESKDLNNKLDEFIIEKWGRSTFGDYSEILVERIKDKKDPLNKDNRKIVYNDAKGGFATFMDKGRSEGRFDAENCLKVLRALGDTSTGYHFVENAFGPGVKKFNLNDFLDVAYDTEFSVFTDYQQQQIIQKTEVTFESVEPRQRWIFFSNIRDVVDCSMLGRLKKRYPDDLKSSSLPMRCDR